MQGLNYCKIIIDLLYMSKKILTIIFLFLGLSVLGNDIEIRYHVAGAESVVMLWGINDWDTSAVRPAGTTFSGEIMSTPMTKFGDEYVLKLNLPENTTLEFFFSYVKTTGPFKINFNYLDYNEHPDIQYYHLTVHGNNKVKIIPDTSNIKPTIYLSLTKYSALFFVLFYVLALLLLGYKKIVIKSTSKSFNTAMVFCSIYIGLVILLLIIKAFITGVAFQFLYDPFQALPIIFKTALQDLVYASILALIFGSLLIMIKTKRNLIIWVFGIFAFLSILLAMINVKVIELMGRPFTYQWLYYADFLHSTDAKRAISANVDKKVLLAYTLMCATLIPITWLTYQIIKKFKYWPFVVLSICFILSLFAKDDPRITAAKKANPVIYFLSSVIQKDGTLTILNKDLGNAKEFIVKNKNILMPAYEEKFKQAGIKNIVFFVLESTPAEYITPFNSKYNATPFLDSIKSSAIFFDAFYAHAPATNISMVSMLCGTYPYLSYKALTAEKPEINWPSITSELKSSGYRTAFFSAGDNQYNGADNFLSNRKIDTIQDYRTGACNEIIFSKQRYINLNLDGIKDSCLSANFLNWVDANNSTPFFSMLWTFQTHYPYYSTGKSIDFKSNNESLNKYLNALHEGDEALKELVEGLQKRNLLNSTLIIVVGDHGEAFGRHGQTSHAGGIFDENLHIPLILINPVLFHGEHHGQVGGISDLAPTLFSILNKPIPSIWQGENLFSIYRRNKVYFFNPYSDILFGFREGDLKFIYNASTNVYSLFNLKNDPHEEINIAENNKPYVEASKQYLQQWIHYQTDFVNGYLK